MKTVEAACAEALACGACSAIVRPARVPRDVVLNILARQRQPPPPAAVPTPEGLQLRHQPVADCQRYDSLRVRLIAPGQAPSISGRDPITNTYKANRYNYMKNKLCK